MCDILLVTGNTKPYNLRESYDSMLLATILDNNNQKVKILGFSDLWDNNYTEFCNNFTHAIIETNCKIVVFQTFCFSFLAMLRIANTLKTLKPEIKNLFWGDQVTSTGSALLKCMPFIDYIYIGEPEKQITNITKSILSNDLKNLNLIQYLHFKNKVETNYNYSEENIAEVEDLPNVNIKFIKSAMDKSVGYYFPLNVGRGCPYRCSYCNVCTSRSRRFRLISAQKTVDSIKHYMKAGYTNFEFTHDSFFVNEKKIFELCDLIKKSNLNIKLSAGGRIDNVSEKLLDRMIECGFDRFYFGIETGSPRIQQVINKKLDLKESFEMIKYLKAKKVYVECYFMFGFPEETEEDLSLTVDYILDIIELNANIFLNTCYFATGSKMYYDYYDKLIYNKKNKYTLKSILGCNDEENFIKENKEIFAYLYNFDSNVRNNYVYLDSFINALRKFPYLLHYLREASKKESILNLYNIFVNSNFNLNSLPYIKAREEIEKNNGYISNFVNSLKDNMYFELLKEILEFEIHLTNCKNNQPEIKTYNFDFIALKSKAPIEKISDSTSNLLIHNINGNIMVNYI